MASALRRGFGALLGVYATQLRCCQPYLCRAPGTTVFVVVTGGRGFAAGPLPACMQGVRGV